MSDEDGESAEESGGPIERFTEEVQEKVDQANQIHEQIDTFSDWSKEQAASVQSRADLLHELGEIDDEDRANYYQAARQIRTVAQRLTFPTDEDDA